VRLVPQARDPEAYQMLRPLRRELDALLTMLGTGPLAGRGLGAEARRLATADPVADAEGLLIVGTLAPREDLDAVERLWRVATGTCARGPEEWVGWVDARADTVLWM
jgi:hypothetical protein